MGGFRRLWTGTLPSLELCIEEEPCDSLNVEPRSKADPCGSSTPCSGIASPDVPDSPLLTAGADLAAPEPPANRPPPIADDENMPLLNTLSPPPKGSSNSELGGWAVAPFSCVVVISAADETERTKGIDAMDAGADGKSLNPGGAGAIVGVCDKSTRAPLPKKGLEKIEEEVGIAPVDAVRERVSGAAGGRAFPVDSAWFEAAAAPWRSPGAGVTGPNPGGCDRVA